MENKPQLASVGEPLFSVDDSEKISKAFFRWQKNRDCSDSNFFCRFKASRLFEGYEYYFRVIAENQVGTSEPCEMVKPVKAKLPFGESIFSF